MAKPSELPVNESWGATWSGRRRFGPWNNFRWIYRFSAKPGNAERRRPAAFPGLGPGSALGSGPRVALSSAQAIPVYRGPRPQAIPGRAAPW